MRLYSIFPILVILALLWPDFPGRKKYKDFLKQETTVSAPVDNTAPVVPTLIAFDSLGTDSTEWLASVWPDEGSTGSISLFFADQQMKVAGDSTLADTSFYATDSISTSKHWAHGQTEYGTVFYMLVQADASSNETVTTGYYILDHLTDYGDKYVFQIIGSTFTLPIYSGGTYSALVDWGDGDTDSVTTYNDADRVHTYASSDTYKVAISGTLYGWRFNGGGSATAMYTINNWGSGTFRLGSNDSHFKGCSNLISVNTSDTLDLTGATTLESMFSGNTKLVDADSLKNLQTASIEYTHSMFMSCDALISIDLSSWDMSSNVDMGAMFLSSSNIEDVGDLHTWTTSSLIDVARMFDGCTKLDSVWVYGWDVTNVSGSYADDMFNGVTMTNEEYDSLLINWAAQSLNYNVTFGAGSSQYTAIAQRWRDTLTTTYLWTITDGGCVDCITQAPTFVTVDTFATGVDSVYATADTWCANTTGFWVLWDDTLISVIADSSNADSLAWHAAADSAGTFKWNHPFTDNGSKAYVTIIATDGYNYEFIYDSVTVNAFDETAPANPTFIASGVQYDSVRIQLTHVGETGAYMMVRYGSDVADTLDGTSWIDWYTLGNLDSTALFDVGQDSTVWFFVFAKDSIDNVSNPDSTYAEIQNVPVGADATPPNTTGAITTFFTTANADSIHEVTGVSSDSADVAGYLMYARSSAIENWVFLDTLTTVPTDTSLDITQLVSVDGNDTLFTKLAAFDEAGNIDPTGIDTFRVPADSTYKLVFDTHPETFTWFKVEFSAGDSTSDGDSLYVLSYADTVESGDSTYVYLDSTWYAQDSIMYSRTKFYNLSWSDWGAWFGDTLIAEAEGGGGECDAYEICQNFEGTGYDNSETWVESPTGTVNEDYTDTVLRGSQSLAISDGGVGVGTAIYISNYARVDTSYWMFFRIRADSITTAGNTTTGGIYDNESTLASFSLRDADDGGVRLYSSASTNVAYAVSANTTYYVWLYYKAGTGANGIARLYIDTDRTIPLSPNGEITNSTRTVVPDSMRLYNNQTGITIMYDQIIGDSTAVGDVAE